MESKKIIERISNNPSLILFQLQVFYLKNADYFENRVVDNTIIVATKIIIFGHENMLLITSLEKSMEIIFIDYFCAVYSFFYSGRKHSAINLIGS